VEKACHREHPRISVIPEAFRRRRGCPRGMENRFHHGGTKNGDDGGGLLASRLRTSAVKPSLAGARVGRAPACPWIEHEPGHPPPTWRPRESRTRPRTVLARVRTLAYSGRHPSGAARPGSRSNEHRWRAVRATVAAASGKCVLDLAADARFRQVAHGVLCPPTCRSPRPPIPPSW
jgi:hypothetical protein